ncbi:MAG: hypothetical protein H6619_02865 [Deltaproteobacteria bacterium]|nr:hypothetical protein [Deltaproteobacteria bacterium]
MKVKTYFLASLVSLGFVANANAQSPQISQCIGMALRAVNVAKLSLQFSAQMSQADFDTLESAEDIYNDCVNPPPPGVCFSSLSSSTRLKIVTISPALISGPAPLPAPLAGVLKRFILGGVCMTQSLTQQVLGVRLPTTPTPSAPIISAPAKSASAAGKISKRKLRKRKARAIRALRRYERQRSKAPQALAARGEEYELNTAVLSSKVNTKLTAISEEVVQVLNEQEGNSLTAANPILLEIGKSFVAESGRLAKSIKALKLIKSAGPDIDDPIVDGTDGHSTETDLHANETAPLAEFGNDIVHAPL